MGNLGGISKILIENFRSIEKMEINLEDYCTLIGANNAGKSNILRAINLVLGEIWPTDKAFTEDDFYKKETKRVIKIGVMFKSACVGYNQSIHGVGLICRASEDDKDVFKVEFYCLDQNEKSLKYNNYPNAKYMRPNKDIRSHCPLIYLDTNRNYNYTHAPSNRWSVLRKIFNKVNDEFVNSEDNAEFEKHIDSAYEILKRGRFSEIEKELKKNLEQQLSTFGSQDEIELNFKGYDPANAFKSLQLHMKQMEVDSLAEDVGSGVQSLIVIAILRTYMQMEKSNGVLVIEEPESFLHPQKVRHLASILKEISENGQVIVSTHSPVFVDVQSPETIFLIGRSNPKGTEVFKMKKTENNHQSYLRVANKFNLNANEMFFARLVIFVEGQSEFFALPILLKTLGVDIDKQESTIVMCGGKKSIPSFARIAKDLKIPFLILMDRDTGEQQDTYNANVIKEFDEDNVHILSPNFEGAFGSQYPRGDNKVVRAIENAENLKANPEQIPQEIKNFASKIEYKLRKLNEAPTQNSQSQETPESPSITTSNNP